MQNMYEAFLGDKNRIYYLAMFEQFDKRDLGLKTNWSWPAFFGSKTSWNWPAFFCIGIWALYRKMYGWFFAYLGISMLLQISMKNGYPELGALIFIVAWIAFTILANSLYHNSVKKKIAVAQFTFKDESKLLEFLHYKGGVNTWVFWTSGLLSMLVLLAIVYIASNDVSKHASNVQPSDKALNNMLDDILRPAPSSEKQRSNQYQQSPTYQSGKSRIPTSGRFVIEDDPATSGESGRDAYVKMLDFYIGDGTPAIRRQTVEDPAFVTFLNLKDQGTGRIIRDIAEEADRKRDAARMAEIYKSFFIWKKNTFNQR